jgi:hypothetical protein
VSYRVYIEEPPSLLDDLLEDSARRYHRHCAIIQRVFHERWLVALQEVAGDRVEARARERLRFVRAALREAEREMIREEAEARDARDAATRTYAAALPDPGALPATA